MLLKCILIIKAAMRQQKLKILFLAFGIGLLATACTKKEVDIDLSSREWKVEKIRKSGKLIYTNTDSTYVLTFNSNESYSLDLDVNSCIGLYEIRQKGNIAFQAMACTEICCDTEFAADLAGLFPEMTGYYVRDNRLYFDGNGEIILTPL